MMEDVRIRNGIIVPKVYGTRRDVETYYGPQSKRGKKEFYRDCFKDMEDIAISFWSDTPRTALELEKIAEDLK